MSVKIGNPYAPIASIYTDGLDTIIGALKSKPTVDDLASAVNDVVSSVFYGGSPTVIVGIEIQTMINAAISSYVKGDSLSSRYLSPISFNDITVDAIGDRIENLESNILDSKLSPEVQKPLLISTLIGNSTYSYFADIIAKPPSPNPWKDYFDTALVSPIDNLPYWVTASVQSSFTGASSPGLLQPSSEQAGSEIISALASAWVVTVGKVIFRWIPEIKEPTAPKEGNCGCGCTGNNDHHSLRLWLSNLPNARKEFAKLSHNDKYGIWKDKQYNIINHAGWNNVQLSFINKTFGLLSPNVFLEGTGERSNFLGLTPSLEKEAIKIFTKVEIQNIFGYIHDYGTQRPYSTNPDCECHVGTDIFCGGNTVCKKVVIGCNYDWIGCGWFWSGSCDGMCLNSGIE